MSDTGDFYYLGKVVKTHGIDGELSGFVDADDPLHYSSLHGIFIKTKQGLIPHVFESFSIDSKGFCLFKLKGIDNIEKAKRFMNKEMYLPLTMLPVLTGNSFYFHEITGFTVSDKHHGSVGNVTGVIEHVVQPLIQVDHQGTEILIPIHNDIIQKVDKINKILFINAPEGLIDIYLTK